MAMRIVIPTRGRENQLTLSWFPKELRLQTTVIAPKRDIFKLSVVYHTGVPDYVVQPDPTWTIAKKRAWIIQEWAPSQGYDKILMLDDDLRFSTRISEDDWHLKELSGEELIPEFKRLEDKLGEEFPHVGFGPRQGNNRLEDVGWRIATRMQYSLGYYIPIVKECELGRIETREDMDLTLQLLRKGYPNAVWQTTVNDQRKFDAPGGASSERTIESSNADAKKLAELHPGYVTTTERKYKASVPRVEVICQWGKAYQDGKAKRLAEQNSQTV
jgi:hypothetical protein